MAKKIVTVSKIEGINGYKRYQVGNIKLVLPTPNKKVEKEIARRLLEAHLS